MIDFEVTLAKNSYHVMTQGFAFRRSTSIGIPTKDVMYPGVGLQVMNFEIAPTKLRQNIYNLKFLSFSLTAEGAAGQAVSMET